MAYVVPSDTHVIGDPGHTSDHDNIADVLGLLTAVAAQGTGPYAVRETPPAGNASAVAALQAVQSWSGLGIGSGYFPWQFPPEAYGALGNGRIITDATMVSGSPNLTSAAQANFINATVALGGDIGKSVLCSSAGGGTYTALGSKASAPCYIISVTSPTVAVLSVNAGSTTPGASIAVIASDDSAAFLACEAAAIAYAEAHQHGYVELIGSNALYGLGAGQAYTATNASPCVFSVPTYAYANGSQVYLNGTVPTGFSSATAYFVVNSTGTGLTFQLSATSGGTAINSTSTGSGLCQYSPVNYGGYLGNSLLPLPVNAPTAQKIIPTFTGPTKSQDQSLVHWLQTVPQAALSQLVCMRTDGTNNGTYGPASVAGSPIDGYGNDLGLFTNIMPVVDGMQILVPYNSTYGGWDFFGCAESIVPNGSCMPLALVNYSNTGGAPYPNMYLNASANISNQWTAGLRLPCTGNNDRSDVIAWSCEGLCYGLMPSEHSFVAVTRNTYCVIGVEFYSGNAAGMPHSCYVGYASVESVGGGGAIGFFDGTINVDVAVVDCESVVPILYDPSNRGIGTVQMRVNTIATYYTVGTIVSGSTLIRLISLDNAQLHGVIPVGTSGYPSVPSTTVAQPNGFYRDCFVYITSTAAISNTKVNGVTVSALTTAGAGSVVIPVPGGLTYTVTTTGTITMQWLAW